MTKINTNANIHTSTNKTVFDHRQEKRFIEYRKKWSENPAHFIVEDFPIHLDIESTSACNLRCSFCARTMHNWGPNQNGYLDFSLYKKIIDEGVANGLYAIKLSMRGEPLLHPKLPEMVEYAKKKGIIDVYFNTNAVILTEDKVNQLIDAGLDRISISFEGITKEDYEKYRQGANYETVVANIRRLRAIRDERGVSHPQIRIQTVLLPELRESYDQYVEFWKTTVDEVSYIDARHEGPDDDHRGYIADWACPFLWQRMAILWDGTILPCSMWGVSDFSLWALGNVNDVSIKDLWNGLKIGEARKLHKKGMAHRIKVCDCCAYRATELEKLGLKKLGKD